MRFHLFAAAAAVLSTSLADAGEKRPFSVHDMLAMDRISDVRPSPDGARLLFTLRKTDLEGNRGATSVWVVGLDGKPPQMVAQSTAGAWNARWAQDGGVLYLSGEGGTAQVWKLDLETTGSQRVTAFEVEVDNLEPFPDGRRLLLSMQVYPDLEELDETAVRDHDRAADKVTARVYDDLLFRHWDTWEDGKRSHLFVYDTKTKYAADLMKGWDADSPTRPFGGFEEVAIAPDGSEVAFACKKVGREAAWSTDVDVWVVPSDGSAEPRCVTEDNEAYDSQPSYSPDGTKLAWLAMERPGYEADRQRIVLMDRASGEKRVLTDAWDRSASSIAWSADGRTIYTSAADLGQRAIFAVDVASGEARRLVAEGTNSDPFEARRRLVYLHDDLNGPAEIASAALDGGDVRRVTDLNGPRVASAAVGEFEQFTFAGWNGETVHGYVMKPVGFEEGVKYPVAFLIHGGPQGSFGNHFHYRWNPQAYAGAGYAAVFIDFHGSTGYGQAFCDSIRGDWGGKPYEDLMKGLDHALATYDFLDGERVGALGASYGGYMINWIAGQTDRFACLVNHDGNLDERMAYYDTEELWFPEWDHMGTPWENPEGYAKHNPIEHVDKWKTPMLVIHGAKDYRVVDTQGMSTFTALQRRGIPSRFLYFPDENHWVLKPKNSILWHDTVIGWLDRWLKPDGEARAVPASSGSGGR